MDKRLRVLVKQARNGEDEPFQKLVRALGRKKHRKGLVGWIGAKEPVVRRAALTAARKRDEPEVLEAAATLAQDDEAPVRAALAEAIAAAHWPLDPIIDKLLTDADAEVRLAAATGARGRPAVEATLLACLRKDDDWRVRQAAARSLADSPPRPVLSDLLTTLAEDADCDVREACAGTVEKLLGSPGVLVSAFSYPVPGVLRKALAAVNDMQVSRFPVTIAWLKDRLAHDVDVELLCGYGPLLTGDDEAKDLPRAHGAEEACESLRKLLTGTAPRAVALLGEPGSGKTAVIQQLAHQLRNDPEDRRWHIVQVKPADFLVGTVYLGQWETKLNKLIEAIRTPHRVILYIPSLEQLSAVGKCSKSDMNVASTLAPYLARGEIAVLGESTIEGFRTGLGSDRSLRRLFHTVELRAAGAEQTRSILQAVCEETHAMVPNAVLDRLGELADYYLAGTAQPGRSVGLLRRVLSLVAGKPGPVTVTDILTTLSTATGIPADYLDDGVPLHRATVCEFLGKRVMGQPEAVDTVVDLVTLIKAGLADPNKPFGVLLFVGPTGVGKTELARALAEILFGDPNRMIRLDMSEYATADSFERLIGVGTNPGLLTSAVREKPFSVVLLDEIEKANLNFYDLCLQIFDSGRLTDTRGCTADFRRTIIILTSNIGAGNAPGAALGFGREAVPDAERSATEKALQRWFRPEFLNRLDRVVHFRPLEPAVAEKISRREVARVLERSGIVRRRLTVEVDAAVYSLLMREGYSRSYGARPLKRTVERRLLVSVGQALTAQHIPAGSVLRLVAEDDQVRVQIVAGAGPLCDVSIGQGCGI